MEFVDDKGNPSQDFNTRLKGDYYGSNKNTRIKYRT